VTTQEFIEMLVVEHCCSCGVAFGMTQAMHRDCRRRSQASPHETRTFYCPNGHPQSYIGENVEQRLRDELKWQQERNAALDDIVKSERRSHAATKGQLTKTRKRVGDGVCPCCNRSFASLAAHMASKHPDYAQPSESSGRQAASSR
jgi:hypothetical protein